MTDSLPTFLDYLLENWLAFVIVIAVTLVVFASVVLVQWIETKD